MAKNITIAQATIISSLVGGACLIISSIVTKNVTDSANSELIRKIAEKCISSGCQIELSASKDQYQRLMRAFAKSSIVQAIRGPEQVPAQSGDMPKPTYDIQLMKRNRD